MRAVLAGGPRPLFVNRLIVMSDRWRSMASGQQGVSAQAPSSKLLQALIIREPSTLFSQNYCAVMENLIQ